jgi:hypothetical protein
MKRSFIFLREFISLALLLAVASVATAQTWTYDFGTGTDVYDTPGPSTSFLPPASRGTARVSLSGDGSFTLVNPGTTLGTNSELQVLSSSSVRLNKFGIYGYPEGNTAHIKFSMRFSRNRAGSWYFYLGNGGSFSNDEPADPNESFLGLRWSFDLAGTVTASIHQNSGWTDLPDGSFLQNTDYTVDIYANNSADPAAYDKNGGYYMAPNTADIWINNTLVADDVAKLALADLSGIDSWMFYGQDANSTAMLILDDLQYANFVALKVLPAHFNAVKATAITGGTQLQWENLTEDAIRQYTIERSEDGVHFSAVGLVQPLKNNGGSASYRFVDAPANGTVYYRIQAAEKSGKTYYSTVLRMGSSSGAGLSIYPNPVTDRRLMLTLSHLPEGQYSFSLFDARGREAFRRELANAGDLQAQTLELPDLPKGIYYAVMRRGGFRYYQPVTIK